MSKAVVTAEGLGGGEWERYKLPRHGGSEGGAGPDHVAYDVVRSVG